MEDQTMLQKFASLAWYDAVIEFLFRFVAKTSEPLLAAGIVYSAADVLSKGHIGSSNLMLNNAWAISQALCIESSGGVVLVYGLQSVGEKDKVKAYLYLGLSILLALVGGVMLFMQLAGWEQQNDSSFMLVLFALRCIVSVGYIYLCRTKHIRFTGFTQETHKDEQIVTQPVITIEDIRAIVAETVTSVVTNVIIQVEQPNGKVIEQAKTVQVSEQLQLPEHANSVEKLDSVQPKELVPVKRTRTTDKLSDLHEQETNRNFVRVKEFLEAHPKAKVREVAASLSMSPSTANKWMIKARSEESKN